MQRNRIGLWAWAICLIAMSSTLAGCSKTSHADPAPSGKGVALRAEKSEAVAGASTEAVGTGWGTVKGTFTFNGTAPTLKPLSTGGKDGEVCDAHAIPDERLLVDSATKGLKNVVVYAVKVKRIHPDLEAAKSKEVVFDQKNCLFTEHVLPVWISQTMMIKNSDPIGHNTKFDGPGEPGFNQMLQTNSAAKPMAPVPFKFSRKQDNPLSCTCNVHPWMQCYVLPRDNPYFAVTNAKGEFVIDKVPAGEEIEFQVWHELSGPLAAKPEWSKGRFKLKVPADGTSPVDVQVDSSLFKL